MELPKDSTDLPMGPSDRDEPCFEVYVRGRHRLSMESTPQSVMITSLSLLFYIRRTFACIFMNVFGNATLELCADQNCVANLTGEQATCTLQLIIVQTVLEVWTDLIK